MRFCGKAYSLDDVRRIGAMGLHTVEFNLFEGGHKIPDVHDLKNEANAWGLEYLVHGPNEGKPTEIVRLGTVFFDQIMALLDHCTAVGAKILTVHFWMDGRFIPEDIRIQKREILSRMAVEGAKRGVTVCIENLSESHEDFRPLLEQCPEIGITLDIGHAQLLSPRNLAPEFIRKCPERIRHVHAHDNFGGETLSLEFDRHLPIGEGIIDYTAIFKALADSGYDGTVTLEVPLDHLLDSIDKLSKIANSK